jgi:hypothetical protein
VHIPIATFREHALDVVLHLLFQFHRLDGLHPDAVRIASDAFESLRTGCAILTSC